MVRIALSPHATRGSYNPYIIHIVLQIGSVVLFGLYIIVKYVGREFINWLLQWYFAIAGVGSVSKVSTSSTHATAVIDYLVQSAIAIIRLAFGTERWRQFDLNRFVLSKGGRGKHRIASSTSFVDQRHA